jgi:thymidine phosphorylase
MNARRAVFNAIGAPMDKNAGVYLHKKIGDHVKSGELLYSIYANINADFKFASAWANENIGFTIL